MSWLSRMLRESPEVQALLAAELEKHRVQMEYHRPIWEEYVRAAGRLNHRLDYDRRMLGLGKP